MSICTRLCATREPKLYTKSILEALLIVLKLQAIPKRTFEWKWEQRKLDKACFSFERTKI